MCVCETGIGKWCFFFYFRWLINIHWKLRRRMCSLCAYKYISVNQCWVTVMMCPPPAGVHVAASRTKRDLITSVLFPPLSEFSKGLLIATSHSSSVHQTFLIKFQVNWLRSNIPEAEWQSRSEDDTELLVRESQQQEKGNVNSLWFILVLIFVLSLNLKPKEFSDNDEDWLNCCHWWQLELVKLMLVTNTVRMWRGGCR